MFTPPTIVKRIASNASEHGSIDVTPKQVDKTMRTKFLAIKSVHGVVRNEPILSQTVPAGPFALTLRPRARGVCPLSALAGSKCTHVYSVPARARSRALVANTNSTLAQQHPPAVIFDQEHLVSIVSQFPPSLCQP